MTSIATGTFPPSSSDPPHADGCGYGLGQKGDVCGWEYDPEVGVPEQNIAPGTAFEDLPEDFFCQLCDVGADQFSPID
ncbi:MAG: rubredoxin [Bacteroidaceae bacterium]|nr:rubredoxin [Bacteroidaceae bacterium]